MDAAQNAVEYLFATAAHLWCDQAKDKHSQTPTHAHGLNLSMAAVVQLDHKVRELSKCKEWATDAERRVMQVRSDLKTKRNEKNALPCFIPPSAANSVLPCITLCVHAQLQEVLDWKTISEGLLYDGLSKCQVHGHAHIRAGMRVVQRSAPEATRV